MPYGEIRIELSVENSDLLNVLYTSLLPELREFRTKRGRVNLLKNNGRLVILIEGGDLSILRALANSVLRLIGATLETLNKLFNE